MVIFVTRELESKISNIEIENDGRTIILDRSEEDKTVTLVAIYAPNIDTPEYFRHIRSRLRERSENKIIVGDFNLVLDVEVDRHETYCNNNKSKDEIEDMMDEMYLKDVWRIQHPDSREYSWFKRGEITKASRIDFALVSAGLDQEIKMSQYLPGIQTDHRAFYMVVELSSQERGIGYWKFNNSLLSNTEFIQEMKQEIATCLKSSSGKDACRKWEILKKRIKKEAVDFSIRKATLDKVIIGNLSEKVDEYESRLPLNKEEDKLLEDTRSDLEEKLSERVRGQMFRCKVRWYEEGEKNTKYFFQLEKARYNAKTCYSILQEDGTEIRDQKLIIDKQKQFYEDLYSEDKEVNFSLSNTSQIYVPEHIREQQQKQITMEDLQEAIKGMNNDKTPGSDGIPVDFYKVFWTDIKDVFYEMTLAVFEQKVLHATAREGILNLIPKANKDTRVIKNF